MIEPHHAASRIPGPIPVLQIGAGGAPALAKAAPDRLKLILAAAEAHYGRIALAAGGRLSRLWLERADNPYLAEIAETAAGLAVHGGQAAGAYLLNLSFEWTCTTGVAADPEGRGNRMLRTLDWPLDNLGRALVVARQEDDAGPYLNVTWPGFAGIVTAMAPGRFSAALNQPPAPRWTFSRLLDWAILHGRVFQNRALPPAQLLRRVFDTCRTYAEARTMLIETPLCIPAFFTLSGIAPDEGCVIERTEDQARVREAPACAANHWLSFPFPGWARGESTNERLALMAGVHRRAPDGFAWVQPPILNATTRAAVAANAKRGTLWVQGYESDGPATQPLILH
ncbi:MAG: hypothetical protein FJX42_05825 [Alphaproteobacteria bacterium]|nr:hypothetical protein [Alphaproteobacteria bacterium]